MASQIDHELIKKKKCWFRPRYNLMVSFRGLFVACTVMLRKRSMQLVRLRRIRINQFYEIELIHLFQSLRTDNVLP